ncbi:lipocalin-like domain-containing protein [Catellatospora paridis]|uniref:lipocalin-like domain-containing protein n=1 Tax=Catellatospora paridis TaxID=1617086 RepID=UPI0012D428FF|nr:lipocalin-like domain-containing protein [Catellatospora paridis]
MSEVPGRFSRRTALRALAAGSFVALPGLAACSRSAPTAPPADGPTLNRYGTSPNDYARLNLKPDTFYAWEDGFRTAAANEDPRVYEWWHTELTGDDGIVVSFTLKTRPGDGLTAESDRRPAVNLLITTPWGNEFSVFQTYDWREFASATDRCNVKVGPFTLTGDLKNYQLRGTANDITLNLNLTSTAAPFRPGTGYVYLGGPDQYQAWFAAVPSGKAEGHIVFYNEKRDFIGTGYHDHTWGNLPLPQFVDRWRTGMGVADRYSVIARDIHLRGKYDSTDLTVLLIDDIEAGKRLVAAYNDETLNATEMQTGEDDEFAEVQWNYTGDNSAIVTMSATERMVPGRPYVNGTGSILPASRGEAPRKRWYIRNEAEIALSLGTMGPGYRVTGKGTLDNAQFELLSGQPTPKPKPS